MFKKKINLVTFDITDNQIQNNIISKEKNLVLIDECCKVNKNNLQAKKLKSLDLYQPNNLKGQNKDMEFLMSKYEYSLKLLTTFLNEAHSTKYSKKYWEIILSRWLFTFISETFTKWDFINNLKKKKKIRKIYKLDFKDQMFIPENTFDFHITSKASNLYWSHWTYIKIFEFLKMRNFTQVSLKNNFIKKKNIEKYDSNIYKFKTFYKSSNKKLFFYKLEWDKRYLLQFQLNNYFVNLFYKKQKINLKEKNEQRQSIRYKFYERAPKVKCKFQNFLNLHIMDCLPKSFLENYSELESYYKKNNWPNNPKYILTTYGQYYDELFKIYCAKNIVKGSKLVIFKHGYGLMFKNKDFYGVNIDQKNADIYCSWGDNRKNGAKACYYLKRKISKKFYNFNKVNKNLIISYVFNEAQSKMPNGFISGSKVNQITLKNINVFLKYLKKNLNFYSKILDESGNSTIDYKIDCKKLDTKKNFIDVADNFNLSVHFFVGTPFLEALAKNKPAIVVFQKELYWQFDAQFSKFINLFFKNKIFFSTSKQASVFLNKDYQILDKWWNSKKIQKLRKSFCKKYCKAVDKNSMIFSKNFLK